MISLADVAVPVTNAKTSAEWWQQKLGFEVHTVGKPGGHAIMVAPPGDRFILHLCEGFAPAEPGNSGIAFVTNEIDRLVQRMQAGGVKFTEPLSKESWGSMAKFEDPDGNVFWLLEAPAAFIRTEAARRAKPPASKSRSAVGVKRAARARPGRRSASGRP